VKTFGIVPQTLVPVIVPLLFFVSGMTTPVEPRGTEAVFELLATMEGCVLTESVTGTVTVFNPLGLDVGGVNVIVPL
jgi:hypothetical protein